jgi:arsenate reductase
MPVKIYHNPRCSKSRETLQLVRDKTGEPEIVEYLKTPPSIDELREIAALLGIRPYDLLRTKEPEYTTLGITPEATDDVILKAMVEHPRLIERPIVVTRNGACLGRPPEKVLELL